jgi:hypothetical protein
MKLAYLKKLTRKRKQRKQQETNVILLEQLLKERAMRRHPSYGNRNGLHD